MFVALLLLAPSVAAYGEMNYYQHNQYDCSAGYSNWRVGWSAAKKRWCCNDKGLGCPDTRYPDTYPAFTPYHEHHYGSNYGYDSRHADSRHYGSNYRPNYHHDYNHHHDYDHHHNYDCFAGLSNWRVGWSVSKKDWCCRWRGKGCGDVHGVHDTYDCQAGYSNWNVGWGASKKQWCCHNKGLACPDVSYPDTYPGAFPPQYIKVYHTHYHDRMHTHYDADNADRYDCFAGYAKWRSGWSANKKSWCCVHKGKGCRDERYHTHYHEHVAVHQHNHHHYRRGYVYHHADPYNCHKGYSNWHSGWSLSKKAWCCDNFRRGCEHHIHHYRDVHHLYNCNDGLRDFRTTWSHHKREYCCHHAGRGCEVGRDHGGHLYYNNADKDSIEKAMEAVNPQSASFSTMAIFVGLAFLGVVCAVAAFTLKRLQRTSREHLLIE